MRGRPFLPAIVLILGLASGAAEAQPKTTTRWSRIEDTPGFVGWRAQLQHMADAYGKGPVAHMCVVAATYTQVSNHDTNVWGYLYWKENNQLYTLSQSRGDMDDLAIFKGPLNLETDVVRRESDIHGSNFLVTRAWVNNILHHCGTSGDRLVLRKANG